VSGDFARVCYHEIAARSTVEDGQLTIDAVNSLLDQLAAGRLRQADYVPILRKINQQCTPVEQEWIIRIILKGESCASRPGIQRRLATYSSDG
jgi:DNA ligase-4